MYRIIEPEVPGGLGAETELDNKVHPPLVNKLHFEFSDWLGDDLIESFPCFLMSEALKAEIERNKLSGVIFAFAKITQADNFKLLNPNRHLPEFYWAKITTKNLQGDFSIGTDFRLVVSENAYKVLSKFNIENAVIEETETI